MAVLGWGEAWESESRESQWTKVASAVLARVPVYYRHEGSISAFRLPEGARRWRVCPRPQLAQKINSAYDNTGSIVGPVGEGNTIIVQLPSASGEAPWGRCSCGLGCMSK